LRQRAAALALHPRDADLGRAVDLTQGPLWERIEFLSHEEWFLERGQFDIGSIIGRLHKKLNQALGRGEAGIRLNGGPAWLQGDWQNFHAFEGALDEGMAGRPIIALCNFPLAQTASADMLDAVDTHHFGLTIRNALCTMSKVLFQQIKRRSRLAN
jgi:hypothetical protein